ncbi:MAG TPA: methyltransferase domain-containing protein, partial [Tepidisphaeraceae bacterium]|nr:methyltransferase domain-containing protein [Tepidisphaeraceae bacterium]
DDGLILFTTAFQPPDIEQLGTSWWYIGPRNGHVSLHTPQSILSIVRTLGFRLASSPDGLVHLLFRSIPPFARHLNLAEAGG